MSRRRAASAALPALREERAHLGNHGEGPGKLGGCRRKSSCEVIQVRAPALPAQASGLLAWYGGAPAPRRPAARTTSWGEVSEGGRSPPPSFLGVAATRGLIDEVERLLAFQDVRRDDPRPLAGRARHGACRLGPAGHEDEAAGGPPDDAEEGLQRRIDQGSEDTAGAVGDLPEAPLLRRGLGPRSLALAEKRRGKQQCDDLFHRVPPS